MWRSVRNYLAHAVPGQPRGWHPLLAVYYLTYACEFRCLRPVPWGFSLILNQPSSMAQEAVLMLKAAWKGRRRKHETVR